MKTTTCNTKDKIVLALDVPTKDAALKLVRELKDYTGMFKVGLQLFMSEGFDIIKALQDEGVKIFFDVKLHDIPNTVAQASKSIIQNNIDFFNIHTSGGKIMMSNAVKTANETAFNMNFKKPTILGVTALSSINQEILTSELSINTNVNDYVNKMALLAKESGLSGIVASVLEAKSIRQLCGDNFIILCPGIRPAFAKKDDQQRIATPADAIKAGADYIVIGRAVTAASDRIEAIKMIHEEIAQVYTLI